MLRFRGSQSQSVFDRISLFHFLRIMVSDLDTDCDPDTDPDPEGLAARPAVRDRPKPRLLALVDYFSSIHVRLTKG